MNKVMAILLLLGALGAFGLSQRTSYEVQEQSKSGAPVGKPRTVYIGAGDRAFFIVLGAACMVCPTITQFKNRSVWALVGLTILMGAVYLPFWLRRVLRTSLRHH
jgi:hypothetical protein